RVLRAIKLQNSNYDTDLFMDTIRDLESISGKVFGKDEQTDIAFRVIADHIRALAFCIADGQLPSNTGAGYVLRRILRRAVRYGYSFLGLKEPFLHKIIDKLAEQFKGVFDELYKQKDFVAKVIEQEEISFLRTLFLGLDRLDSSMRNVQGKVIDGQEVFELYDTFGFPIDLTQLIAAEKGLTVDMDGFNKALAEQKARSKADAVKETGDWQVLLNDEREEFVGYDYTNSNVRITRYRTLTVKGKKKYQLVFNLTPYYAESGGQVGDTGRLIGEQNGEEIKVLDTQKENDLIVHVVDQLPKDASQVYAASIDLKNRENTQKNHSATHLLHAALKQVLGNHVGQKGSLVDPKKLRFDFSHFAKVSDEELREIEHIVNTKVSESIPLDEKRNVPYDIAINSGVTALFGEKYGDVVRVITFSDDFSKELCGGTHVSNTAEIGQFVFVSESSVAAGVRRVEAITGDEAEAYFNKKLEILKEIEVLLGHPKDLVKQVQDVLKENKENIKKLEVFGQAQLGQLRNTLQGKIQAKGDVNILIEKVDADSPAGIKDVLFQLRNEVDNLFAVLVADINNKPSISIMISDSLVKDKGWNAGQLIREWAKEVKGGGGGQPFFAQAGGADLSGLGKVLELALGFVSHP
ncbi:MAG: alanyl-tRNA synthetase, partial [Bacteroidia bacterium]